MVAGIEVRNGKASFFSGEGIVAWHGLGTVIKGLATAREALALGGLDWTVEKRPIWYPAATPLATGATMLPANGRYAVVRDIDEKWLGIVSDDYRIHQNVEAFEFFDAVTDAGTGEAHYTAAGALAGGSRIFLTAKIGETFNVAGDDAHDMYLLITTSHDGTRSFTAATTMVRAVCQNTVTLALNQAKSTWSLSHKSTLAGKAQQARESLEMSFKYKDAFEEEVERLLDIEVTKDQFQAIVAASLPEQKRQTEKNVAALMHVFESEPTVINAPGVGTGWGAFNAATYWVDHVRESRSAEARYKSLTQGGIGYRFSNDVKDKILALA